MTYKEALDELLASCNNNVNKDALAIIKNIINRINYLELSYWEANDLLMHWLCKDIKKQELKQKTRAYFKKTWGVKEE